MKDGKNLCAKDDMEHYLNNINNSIQYFTTNDSSKLEIKQLPSINTFFITCDDLANTEKDRILGIFIKKYSHFTEDPNNNKSIKNVVDDAIAQSKDKMTALQCDTSFIDKWESNLLGIINSNLRSLTENIQKKSSSKRM